jgi:large subunit ribosomal protein L15
MKRLLNVGSASQLRALTQTSKFGFSKVGLSKYADKLPKVSEPFVYKFPFNNLNNPLDKYIDLKENTLCDNQGARKKRKRLGRGRASHHGKTSGHGHLGQGQRRNKKKWGFEGGQTPIMRRLPKLGRTKGNKKRLDYINFHRLVYCLERKWLTCSPDKYITIKDLVDSGTVTKVKHGVKLLSKGYQTLARLPYPIFIEVNHVSKPAVEAIVRNGGKVRIRYMTQLKLKEHVHPEYFRLPLAEPLPPKDAVVKLEEYRDLGCEVIYRIPKWVADEMATGAEYFKPKEKASLKELVESRRLRVKPVLPKQYNFSF